MKIHSIITFVVCMIPMLCMSKGNALLHEIEKYFNDIHTLRADFQQINPDASISKGVFYLAKPGKLCWTYTAPKQVIVIFKNKKLAYYNAELRQVNYFKVDSFINELFIAQPLRLTRQNIRVYFNNSLMHLVLREPNRDASVTVNFLTHPTTLHSVEFYDMNFKKITVYFSDVQYNIPLKRELFSAQSLPQDRLPGVQLNQDER